MEGGWVRRKIYQLFFFGGGRDFFFLKNGVLWICRKSEALCMGSRGQCSDLFTSILTFFSHIFDGVKKVLPGYLPLFKK